MCGIAGQWIVDSRGRVDQSRILPTSAVLHHRGPDEWGYHIGCAGSALLLSTRLSIVDLANGRQPLSNEDGSVWVVLNGEIYDFARIARALESRGHRFRTRSDTEVIVHLYEEHGEDFVDHLRGEFAIALLDERQERLYLVRDRFGIKPLSYAEIPGGLVFGSEVKAIFQHPAIPRRLNRRRVFQTLHGILVPGDTYFEGVQDVEPGFILRATRSGVTRRRYWDLPFPPEQSPATETREAQEEYRRLLYESVQLRLHGDVEIGTFLSGGVDSMSIAAAAVDLAGLKPKAFTIAFANERFNESAAAARFAETEGLEHHVVLIGPGDLGPAFERSVWHNEIAVANSHGVAKMLLAETARRHVKAVLTGEGADESLAGYNVFRHLSLLEKAHRHPGDAQVRAELKTFVASMGLHGGILPIRAYSDYDRIQSLFGCYPYAMARALKLKRAVRHILARDFVREMSGVDAIEDIAAGLGRGALAGIGPVAGHQYYAFKTDLACYILACLGDRAEMAHSLEGRVPFLDHKLVEFSCQLPVDLKLRDNVGKYVLRQAMKHRVPAAVNLRKRPFMAPSAETLGLDHGSEHLGRYFERTVIERVGIFDPLALSLLRSSMRIFPGGSYVHSLAETLLTIVASVHAMHDLFCERFDDSVRRFDTSPRQRQPVEVS